MKSLTGGKKEWTTNLSCAGLIYFHFGHRVISIITGENCGPFRIMESVDSILSTDGLYKSIYYEAL